MTNNSSNNDGKPKGKVVAFNAGQRKRPARVKGRLAPDNPLVDLDVIRAASNHPDAEQAINIVTDWAVTSFDVRHALEIEAAKLAAEPIKVRLKEVQAELKAVRAELVNTPEWIPASQINDDREGEKPREVPFLQWQRRHQFEAVLSGAAAGTVLTTSMLTAHASLVASGIPVFIENPALPYLVGAVAPTASIAVKLMGTAFPKESARAIFRMLVHFGTAASFTGWLGLFAAKYHGLGGSLDIFAETSALGDQVFTALQIGTEVLVGASLFLHLDRIAARYSPDYVVHNFPHQVLKDRETALVAEESRLTEELAPAQGRLEQLDADRKRHVTAAKLALLDRRGRYDS